MKLMSAVIQSVKFGEVRAALKIRGVRLLRVDAIIAHGRNKGEAAFHRSADCVVDFIEIVKLEIAVPDELVGKVVEIIGSAAITGRAGDCRIRIIPLAGTI